MNRPSVERGDDAVVLRGLPPAITYALRMLPILLGDDAPGVRSRVELSPYAEDEGSEDWVRYATPELEHLFATARELVLGDLDRLEPEDEIPPAFRISIPGTHVNAWLAALNAARVGLGERHEIDEDDTNEPPTGAVGTERDRAILLVHLLGWVQALLIRAEDPDA